MRPIKITDKKLSTNVIDIIKVKKLSAQHLFLFMILCLFCLVISSGSAIKITEMTNASNPENFKITLNDIKNNSFFQLTIDGAFDVKPGQPFSFGIKNFSMPYDLKGAILTANVEKGNYLTLIVKKGDIVLKKDSNNKGTISIGQEITPGTYDLIELDGKADNKQNTVKIKIQLSGMKIGPNNSVLSFSTEGITKGNATINVYVDKKKVFSTIQKINVNGLKIINTIVPVVSPVISLNK